MLNVSGHLMSTAEVESVLTGHSSIAEAAVVSKTHPVKGQCLYCFITPNEGIKFEKKLQDELKQRGEFLVIFLLSSFFFYFSLFFSFPVINTLKIIPNIIKL